jgi:hypothetical protein
VEHESEELRRCSTTTKYVAPSQCLRNPSTHYGVSVTIKELPCKRFCHGISCIVTGTDRF